jgi:hypothetical protein
MNVAAVYSVTLKTDNQSINRGVTMTVNEKHTHLQHVVEYCKLALWMLLMCSPAFVIALSVTDRL